MTVVAETMPAPAEEAPAVHILCPSCLQEQKCAAVDVDGHPVVTVEPTCGNCGHERESFGTYTFHNATPEQIAAHRASVEASGAATDRINKRVERGEPAYPATVLCACCKALPEADLVRRLDYDITLDNCSVCGLFLGVLPCPTPIGRPLASLVDGYEDDGNDGPPEAAQ